MVPTADDLQEAKHVSFTYDQVNSALDDVSFTIPQGSIFAVLGPHGSGKTTLFNLLLGELTPSSGSIVCFDGLPHENDRAGHIGWVPSQLTQSRVLTLDEYLRMLECIEPNFDRAFANDLLAPFELIEVKHRLVGALSHGLQKKIQLIGAMAHRPRMLILDEPFAGLDPQSQYILETTLRELRRQGTTVVISSHQIEVVHYLATHVAILDHGRLCTVGTPEQLLQREQVLSLRDLYLKVTNAIEATAERAQVLRQLLEPSLARTLEAR